MLHPASCIPVFYSFFIAASQFAYSAPRLAFLIGSIGLTVPWFFPADSPGLRGYGGIASMFFFMRLVELIFHKKDFDNFSPGLRALHVFFYFDMRERKPVVEPKERSSYTFLCTAELVIFSSLTVATLFGCWYVLPFMDYDNLPMVVLFYALCAAHFYTAMEANDAAIRAFFISTLGWRFETTLKAPFQSRSLREFWGQRWNRAVQPVLKRFVQTPCKSRGLHPIIGLFGTFALSGFIHSYPLLVAGFAMEMAMLMFSYFILQGVLIVLESLFLTSKETYTSLKAFNKFCRVVWTFAGIVFPSPLVFHAIVGGYDYAILAKTL
eukprot:Colp12_sorted_trinity150504_noHs@11655